MTLQGLAFALWGALGELMPASTVIGLAGTLGVVTSTLLRPPHPSHDQHPPTPAWPVTGDVGRASS